MTNRGVILLQFDLKCHWILVWPSQKFRNSRSEIEFCTVDWHEKIVNNINIVLFTEAVKISDFLASANLKISKIFVILTLTDLLISMNVQSNKTGHDESSWMSIFLRKNFLGTALKSSAVWRKRADPKSSSFFVMVSSWYHHGRPWQVNPQVTPSYLELRCKLCSDSYSLKDI